jgi:hypothetical protein
VQQIHDESQVKRVEGSVATPNVSTAVGQGNDQCQSVGARGQP